MTDAALPVAGWYADPADGTRARWWDGVAWTQHTRIHPAHPDAVATTAAEPAVVASDPEPPPAPALPTRRSRRAAEAASEAPQPHPVVLAPVPQTTATPPGAPLAPPAPLVPLAPRTGYTAPHPTVAPPVSWTTPPPPPPHQYGGRLYNPAYDAYHGKNSAAAWALGLGIVSAGLLLLRELLGSTPGLTGIGALIWGIVGTSRARNIGVGMARSVVGLALGGLTTVISLASLVVIGLGAVGPHDHTLLESDIVRTFSTRTGLSVTAVCPTSPPLTMGTTFECTATDSSGVVHPVQVHVQDDKGSLGWTSQ
ncbi:hypothetical protein A0130_06100 [Leifsonia xyli]|uniref:DUF2510 domain-containing protein n=1 Tax=Leifsonia xyli TaxID=1575 RepID=UPI0007CDAAB9|nr:hypothetical protein A0130_06100 [Leifsonia xyli]